VGNSERLGVAVKRRRITADRGKQFLEQLAALNFKIGQPPQISDFPRLSELATKPRLTSYDVAYLDLSKRLSLPLATSDTELERAAVSENIEVLNK
jgi:predicted nucleic acid-binding protein